MEKKKINLNLSYEEELKSSKRKKREYSHFCVEKNGLNGRNDIKFLQNKIEIKRFKI